MSVIPVSASIGRCQTIVETLTGLDRCLRHTRHTVHRIVDSQPVPMHRAGFVEAIFKADNRFPALRADVSSGPGTDWL